MEYIPLTYDPSDLKSRINRYLLTVDSFKTDLKKKINAPLIGVIKNYIKISLKACITDFFQM